MMRLLLAPLLIGVICLLSFLPWAFWLHWALQLPLLPLAVGTYLLTIPYLWLTLRALRRGPKWMGHVSMQFFGVGCVGFVLLLPCVLLSFLFPPQRVALFMVLAWLALTLHAVRRAKRVDNVHSEIADPRIEHAFRAVQISDVHIGSRSADFLARVVDQVLSHKPDVVLITGDLVDLEFVDRRELVELERLTMPVYFCLGNHERYVNLEKALAAIAINGVHVLRDDMHERFGVQFIGVDDQDAPDHLPAALERLAPDPNRFSVVLYHRPDGWAAVRNAGLPLMLAGHTHNGQMWPFGLLVKHQYPEIAGWYERDGSHLYISSGTGTWGPTMRLGTRSEMLVIDFCPRHGEAPASSAHD